MKKATIRDLRYNFSAVESLLQAGQEVQITRRKKVIARMLPPAAVSSGKRPDFLGRLKSIYGDKQLAVSGSELIEAERNRY
jgi:antitoxin (DNA-binding transcriptional repressor) of toxin-antitoxin stability system